MKKLIQWVLFATLCIPVAAGAQQPDADHLVDHKPLMNRVWETFDQMMYKVTKRDGQTIYTPHFPESLRRLDGKTVSLRGYMIPIEPGRRHTVFLLSVLPIYQCMFCGQNGIPPMVEVSVAGGEKIPFSESPRSIRGIVHLNASDESRAELQIREAIVLAGDDEKN
ncbi:MAG TPA: hypothetical protein VNQ55_00010 [Parapedobacter sp.]|nr:hypothetical protein [Parapedobacter sp.]